MQQSNSSRKKYIIIDEELGVFLGTYSMRDAIRDQLDEESEQEFEENATEEDLEELDKKYAIFAAKNHFGIVSAFSFQSEDLAKEFIEQVFKMKKDKLRAVSVESHGQYVGVVDIIKAGYGDATFDMLENLEMISKKIH